MDDPKKRRFLWGTLLAWIPALPLVFMFAHSFQDMSTSHATGLAAVAGGLAEIYVPLGLLITLASEFTAIVLLVRSFSREQSARSAFAAVSICCSALLILAFGLFAWLLFALRMRSGLR